MAGSDLDMISAVRNSIQMLRTEPDEAIRMASQYPAEFIGYGDTLGRIEPGYCANFVLLDDRHNVVETWVGGVASK